MKWLTIEYIKEHSKIDFDCENAELEMLGNSAENTVLHEIRRTLANIKDLNDGTVPADLYHAALMLTDLGYLQHSPVTSTNLSVVPFTLEHKISYWMRHDEATDLQAERNTLLDMLTDVETNLDVNYGDIDSPSDSQTESYNTLKEEISQVREKFAEVENPTSRTCSKLRTRLETVKTNCETAFPDE